MTSMARLAAIFGCAGPALGADERAFFRDVRPWGFILFKRNCETPDQVRALCAALRGAVDDPAAPILIDQEGGRVQRLQPPEWPAYPAAGAIGALHKEDADKGTRAAWLHGRLLATDLAALGITVDCLPVLDLRTPDTHKAIGDRSFGGDVARVTTLALAQQAGLFAGGVLPIAKHCPGHGRATLDSHFALPEVTTSHETLSETDFAVFRDAFAAAPETLLMAMTGHIRFSAIDPAHPATQSETIIREIIRGEIGFDGLLMTDDLSMKALGGDMRARAARARAAGCDIILHCNGVMEEMTAVAEGAGALDGRAAERAKRVERALSLPNDGADTTQIVDWRAEFAHLLDAAG